MKRVFMQLTQLVASSDHVIIYKSCDCKQMQLQLFNHPWDDILGDAPSNSHQVMSHVTVMALKIRPNTVRGLDFYRLRSSSLLGMGTADALAHRIVSHILCTAQHPFNVKSFPKYICTTAVKSRALHFLFIDLPHGKII